MRGIPLALAYVANAKMASAEMTSCSKNQIRTTIDQEAEVINRDAPSLLTADVGIELVEWMLRFRPLLRSFYTRTVTAGFNGTSSAHDTSPRSLTHPAYFSVIRKVRKWLLTGNLSAKSSHQRPQNRLSSTPRPWSSSCSASTALQFD